MDADGTIPLPPHFQYIYVVNVPEDPEVIEQELMKHGQIEDFVFLSSNNGVRNVAVLLPDIPSSQKFASELNETFIRGKQVFTARMFFLTDLARMLAEQKDTQEAGIVTVEVPSVLQAPKKASAKTKKKPKVVSVSIKPCFETSEEVTIRSNSVLSDSVPSNSGIPKLIFQLSNRSAKPSKSVMPVGTTTKTVAKTVSVSAKRTVPAYSSVATETPKKLRKDTAKPTQGDPDKKTWACDREGCIRATVPYLREYAYNTHMANHRLDEVQQPNIGITLQGPKRSVSVCAARSRSRGKPR